MLNAKKDRCFPAILRRQVGEYNPGMVGIVISIGGKRISLTYGFRAAVDDESEGRPFIPARRKDFIELKLIRGNNGKPKKPRTHRRS